MCRKYSRYFASFLLLTAMGLQAQSNPYQTNSYQTGASQTNPYQTPERQQPPTQPSVPPDAMEPDCQDGTPTIDCSYSQSDQEEPVDNVSPRSRSMPRAPYSEPAIPRERETARPATRSFRVVEPPTEFQRFVQSSTGHWLPIFGSSLFERVPSTFAPLDRIPVTPDYTIGPGDEIDLRVWGQVDFSRRFTIDRTGDIFLPQVGRISVSGLKFIQLQNAIKSAMSRVYRNFDLNVNMGQLRSMQIFVVGQARRPGGYTVSSLSTFVNALFASGGPSSRGSLRNLQLRRGNNLVTNLDLYDLLLKGDKSKDVALLPGDVIFIPDAGPRVAVAGSVESPAIYELTQGTSLRDLLQYAGGLSPTAAGRRAFIERIDGGSSLYSEDVNLTPEGLAMLPQNGDVIRILSVVPRFERTVTLRGNVADPVRVAWHAGMKVSDLIPNKDSLLTRGYWHIHNELLDQDSREPFDPLKIPDRNKSKGGEKLSEPVKPYREESRNSNGGPSLAAATDTSESLTIREFVRKNDIQPMAPDIDWDYASIERLDVKDLSTHLIPLELGKIVIEHDASADRVLEPGDVITVFSNADIAVPLKQRTKYIRVEGEIKKAGIYSVNPGETLRDLVARAGGLSPNAYLFGAQFTRESTRKEQQRRYSDFLDQLESDINQSAATLSGRVVSLEQATSAQTTIANERALVARLRQTAATGRIVLDMEPNSTGVKALPEIPLENGDRLFVPNIPSTINVVGMVYNQASFLYAADLRVGDYLQDAGGPSRYGDRLRMFVIRADGSVVARDSRSRLFAGNFNALRMYPGDTVVMPTNVSKTTLLRSLLDWSQVIANFGLGAAAVNVLR